MATDGSDGNDSADAERAKMQSLYRQVNERVKEVNDQRALPEMPQHVICECAQSECSRLIAMTGLEYDTLRAHGTWFAIAPLEEHFFPEVERIVAKNGHYWIVEKFDQAGRIAEQLDSRA